MSSPIRTHNMHTYMHRPSDHITPSHNRSRKCLRQKQRQSAKQKAKSPRCRASPAFGSTASAPATARRRQCAQDRSSSSSSSSSRHTKGTESAQSESTMRGRPEVLAQQKRRCRHWPVDMDDLLVPAATNVWMQSHTPRGGAAVRRLPWLGQRRQQRHGGGGSCGQERDGRRSACPEPGGRLEELGRRHRYLEHGISALANAA